MIFQKLLNGNSSAWAEFLKVFHCNKGDYLGYGLRKPKQMLPVKNACKPQWNRFPKANQGVGSINEYF
jgi:hypothetical protein